MKDIITGLVGLAALVIAVWQLMIFMGARDAAGNNDMTLGMTNLYASVLCFAIAVACVVVYFLRHPRVQEEIHVTK